MMNFREYQREEIFKNHGRPIKVTYDYFQEKKKELESKNNMTSSIPCAVLMYKIRETWNIDTAFIPEIEKVLVYGHLTDFTNNAGFYIAKVKIDSKVPEYEGKTIVFNGIDQYTFPIYRFNNPIDPMWKIMLGCHKIVMDNNGDVLQLFENKPEHIVINV